MDKHLGMTKAGKKNSISHKNLNFGIYNLDANENNSTTEAA